MVKNLKKIDKAVKRETLYILAVTLILSALMQSAALILKVWDLTVLLGNLLGIAAAVGNFFLMGLTVQAALEKEEKDAKNIMKVSQSARLFLLLFVALAAYLIPVFNIFATVIPFLFPRIAITFRPLLDKKTGGGGDE